MKTDEQRPRGRRSLLRGTALALLALIAPGAASGAAQGAQAAAAPGITRIVSPGQSADALESGPDGAIWSLEGFHALAFARYDGAGRRSAIKTSGTDQLSLLTPLADGGMGVVTAISSLRGNASVSFARTDARALKVRSTRLPREARLADAFAIAGDGTVWFADTCGNDLFRWRAGERLVHVTLPRASCKGYAEIRTSLAIGPDGSVWFVNSVQARIVRRDVRGRVREWRYPRGSETYLGPTIVPDPLGAGAAFSEATPDGGAAGLITRSGQLTTWSRAGLPAFGGDGTLWTAGRGGLASIGRTGAATNLALPKPFDATDVAVARDGAPWYLAGIFRTPPSMGAYLSDLEIGTVDSGALVTWPLTGAGEQWVSQAVEPAVRLVLGGDGALWTRVDRSWDSSTLVRVAPDGLGAPRRPTARATLVSARSGRVVTVQLRCAAERGRFCRGTVQLAGVVAAVRYIAPGQSGAAVRLTLANRAARTLRRGRAVRTTAIVRSAGAGATRKALVLRPRARR